MARSRGFRQAHGPRRKSSWEEGVGATGLATPVTATGSAFIGATITPTVGEVTVVRTRGQFVAALTVATGLGDGFTGAVGIGIATLAAVTAGIASVPTPVTEMDWDGWVWHRFFQCLSTDASDVGLG